MKKKSSNFHVLLIGNYPPPIGGVTIHVKRFFYRYKSSDEMKLILLDIKKNKVYIGNQTFSLGSVIWQILSVDIIHIHLSSNIKIFISLLYKLLNKKVIYTQHNTRIKDIYLFKVFMLFVDKLILVNDKDISESVQKYNYALIPAFLPSIESTSLPNNLLDGLKKYKNIISTNCFQMTFVDGKDLYGFDLCVESFKSLVKSNKIKNTLLILVDPSGTTKEYVQKLLATFKEKNNCYIQYISNKIDFCELTKLSTLVIRATRSDGDSLTIREAIYVKTPIIASDVTYRPEGTILFRQEDSDDLAKRILDVINGKSVENNYLDIDYGKAIIKIYKSIEK